MLVVASVDVDDLMIASLCRRANRHSVPVSKVLASVPRSKLSEVFTVWNKSTV